MRRERKKGTEVRREKKVVPRQQNGTTRLACDSIQVLGV